VWVYVVLGWEQKEVTRTWWEQWKLMKTKDFDELWQDQEEVDEKFGNLMRIKGFDGLLMGTRGIKWELFGNLMEIQRPPPLQNKKHPLGACWLHPIDSPHMSYPKVVSRDKLLREVLPMYGIVFNKLRRERKLDGPAKKDYVVHVHILFACLPFCQRISRSRKAEPRVFTIMCAPHLSTLTNVLLPLWMALVHSYNICIPFLETITFLHWLPMCFFFP
jgi:hypothetical protein